MDEELEEEDKLIPVYDIEWPSNPDPTDWNNYDFYDDFLHSSKDLTPEAIAKRVAVWGSTIKNLPYYNDTEIRNEIFSWDLSIPSKDDFDYDNYSIYYARLIQYRHRLTEIMSIVNLNYEMLNQAYKNIKDMSMKLTTGTANDKEAFAAANVYLIAKSLGFAKALYDTLQNMFRSIDFSSYQMDKLHKEHQSLARINNNLNNEGMSNMLNRAVNPNFSNNNNSAVIKTRNSRLS